MKTRWEVYLVFSALGVQRMSKSPPVLRGGERALKLKLKVPPSLFARLFPEATVEVPAEAVVVPKVEVLPVEAAP